MTAQKHLKQRVRARMQKTGESYTSARRQIVAQPERAFPVEQNEATPWYFAGSVPAATALRSLVTHAGIRDPRTRKPFSEAMLFGIAGGIGIGVCSFYYQKADFASFFIAGRHLWHDDLAYLKNAAQRLGLNPTIKESTSAKVAEKMLREALDKGPCIAWVDAAGLPHRAMPEQNLGGAYHVITVYKIDDASKAALIGDLTPEPISIPLANLALARGRIKKDKNRVLSISQSEPTPDLASLIKEGLASCYRGLKGEGAIKAWKANFSLEVLGKWSERLEGTADKDSWKHVFGEGHRLYTGLKMLSDFIEHYGTGGGLCRPMFASFLTEAADASKDASLRDLAKKYSELGRAWSKLADSALPSGVPLFGETKKLQARQSELRKRGGDIDEIRAIWARLTELEKEAKAKFPLSPKECQELRLKLQEQVRTLHEGELDAHEALAGFLA